MEGGPGQKRLEAQRSVARGSWAIERRLIETHRNVKGNTFRNLGAGAFQKTCEGDGFASAGCSLVRKIEIGLGERSAAVFGGFGGE